MSDEQNNDPAAAKPGNNDKNWEQNLISRIALEALNEQRRSRRWGIFFKSLLALYLFALLLLYLPSDWTRKPVTGKGYTVLIEIDGIISSDSRASADNVVTGLRKAFEDDRTRGIILRINSPGGSPVQAGYIHDEVLRLRDENPDIPVYAVITDTCASGGYYIAVAANEIYANRASIVGSIGVVYSGFGFVEALEKLGVERRIMTAGDDKALMDPFSPLENEAVDHLQTMLDDIHQQFIDIVKDGRGDRLQDDERLFSGLIWTGEQSLALGLVDELGSAGYVAREVIGAEEIVDYTVRENYFDRFARRMGSALATELMEMSYKLR